jgi:hypothetical protein
LKDFLIEVLTKKDATAEVVVLLLRLVLFCRSCCPTATTNNQILKVI